MAAFSIFFPAAEMKKSIYSTVPTGLLFLLFPYVSHCLVAELPHVRGRHRLPPVETPGNLAGLVKLIGLLQN